MNEVHFTKREGVDADRLERSKEGRAVLIGCLEVLIRVFRVFRVFNGLFLTWGDPKRREVSPKTPPLPRMPTNWRKKEGDGERKKGGDGKRKKEGDGKRKKEGDGCVC